MTDVTDRPLPAWASHGDPTSQGIPVVHVDAGAMYPAILGELADHYAENVPGEWKKADGELRKEWADCLDGLDVDGPTQYWAEVAFQCMKLEVQSSLRTLVLEIRVHDTKKKYAQANLEPGRAMNKRPGGIPEDEAPLPGRSTTTEAREHYKRLRGFLPA